MVGTPSSRRAGPANRIAGWKPRGEAEADAGLVDAPRDALRAELDDDAERLEHVRRAALRRRARLPCFATCAPGAHGDQRRHRGHVARCPARSPPVPQVSMSASRSRRPRRARRSGASCGPARRARRVVSPLARSADREARDLRVGRLAARGSSTSADSTHSVGSSSRRSKRPSTSGQAVPSVGRCRVSPTTDRGRGRRAR